MSNTTDRSSRGFTLIEALAALLLIAVVLPFVMRGLTTSIRGSNESDRMAHATGLAQMQLEQILVNEDWRFGSETGTFEDSNDTEADRYNWELAVNDWQGTDFRELTMTVRWEAGTGLRSVALKTVVYAGG